jgi:hypothetical protein
LEGKGKVFLAALNVIITVLGTLHGPSEMDLRYCELFVGRELGKGKGVLATLNGMVTVLGTEHRPSVFPRNVGVGQENVINLNNGIRSKLKKLMGVFWWSMYSKGKKLCENYRSTYKLWRERNKMSRNHMGTKLLLNQF